jgi:hypothetical protein
VLTPALLHSQQGTAPMKQGSRAIRRAERGARNSAGPASLFTDFRDGKAARIGLARSWLGEIGARTHFNAVVEGLVSRSSMIADAGHRQVSAQQRAVRQLRALAKPYRFRIVADAEGFPTIPGRYGRIEWYCDGVRCAALVGGFCALPGQLTLAVHSTRPRLFRKLSAIQGVKRHQVSDQELRAVFPPDALVQVARVIKARRKRTLAPDEARRRGFKPTPRATSGL